MAPFEWTPKLLTHPEFDDDHKELVTILNKIVALYTNGHNNPTESSHLVRLFLDKVKEHTQSEEALMHKTAYARLIPHKIEHDHFISKTEEFCDDLKNGRAALTEETTLFLQTWLYEHIVSVDKSFAKWLNEKEIA